MFDTFFSTKNEKKTYNLQPFNCIWRQQQRRHSSAYETKQLCVSTSKAKQASIDADVIMYVFMLGQYRVTFGQITLLRIYTARAKVNASKRFFFIIKKSCCWVFCHIEMFDTSHARLISLSCMKYMNIRVFETLLNYYKRENMTSNLFS